MNENQVSFRLGRRSGAKSARLVDQAALQLVRARIDEVSVWSVARNAQQIAADAKAPVANDADGIEAYFDFNGAGCSQTLADRSVHARDGLLGGSTDVDPSDPVWVTDGPFSE